jgi:hypothetical protein
MAIPYRHTQPGTVLIIALLLSATLIAVKALLLTLWPLLASAVALVVLAWLFSSLTVEVSEGQVQWYFGPGIWKYRIALADVDSIDIVRNKWWNGFGIRMRPGFRLYNVSGLDAVELRLKSGDVRRIGTNDPQGLVSAMRS